jgi:CubicO group peptidase (beta-lactamase class C family)
MLTLWHLLTHTGGLTVRSYPGYGHADPLPTLSQILSGDPVCNTTGVRRKAVPGYVKYCGGGFTVLQFVIENVTGLSFPDAMKNLVFTPAGMTRARYTAPDRALAAHGHVGGVKMADGWRVHPEYAAAGLWCTPTDLVRLAAALQAAAAGTGNLMSQPMAALMLTHQVGEYGLGFEVATSPSGLRHFEHAGANEGYRSQMIATCDNGPAIAIMTASDHGHIAIHQLQPGICQQFGWPDVAAHTPDPSGPGTVLPSFAQLHLMKPAYEGAYDIDPQTSVTMTGSRMNWTLTLPDGSQCPLDVLTDSHLVSGYPAVDVKFSLNQGYATGITVQTVAGVFAGKRR